MQGRPRAAGLDHARSIRACSGVPLEERGRGVGGKGGNRWSDGNCSPARKANQGGGERRVSPSRRGGAVSRLRARLGAVGATLPVSGVERGQLACRSIGNEKGRPGPAITAPAGASVALWRLAKEVGVSPPD